MRALLLLTVLTGAAGARELADRWFYFSRNLGRDEDVADFRRLAEIAAAHGYNGVCWAGAEGIPRWRDEQLARLEQFKAIAAEHRLEIIPLLFSVGYGGGALSRDPNFAVGQLVEGARFKVIGREAIFQPTPVALRNPGLDSWTGDRPADWNFTDRPGELTFRDTAVKHSGEASLRFECPGARGLGPHARAMQQIPVEPRRHYRLTLWLKAEAVEPSSALRVQVLSAGEKSRTLLAQGVDRGTFDWRPLSVQFNSAQHTAIRLYVGTWGGQTGRYWLDEVSLEEVGLNNVLRRDGCPVTVTGADGTVYEEGRDYLPVSDPKLLDTTPRPSPTITLTPTSRLTEGQELRVSWYHASRVAGGQISVCMSVPQLYDYYDDVARRLAEVLPSRKFLLSMDEIRQGGTDLADQRRGLSMAEILGDCVTRQQAILRRHHPDAVCYIWSDMFDPGHNAHGDYYQVEGDFTGSADHIPRDLVIACWAGEPRPGQLEFFTAKGFRVLGAGYYDQDDLTGSRKWIEALQALPNGTGVMYTTWRNKYDLLAGFGDLAREAGR